MDAGAEAGLPMVRVKSSPALAAVVAVVSLPQARLLYLAAASFHGYAELAGLALVRRILPS